VSTTFADFTGTSRPLKAGPSEVGQTKEVSAPNGGRLQVTVVDYKPNVGPVSDDAMAHVATLTLRITNASAKTYSDDKPSALTILHDSDTAGDNSDDSQLSGSQPCQPSFWDQKLTLAPGASIQGCVPYHVGNNETVVDFNFGPAGTGGATWKLGHG
jgi:hypothetical protein